MTDLDRFNAAMEYGSADRVPNWEAGVRPQTRLRWDQEGCPRYGYHWQWFPGEAGLDIILGR